MNLMNQIHYLEMFDLPLMFSGCSVPAPLVFDDVVSAIVKRCGLLEPAYSEPQVMQELTQLWFRTNQWQFEHLIKIILAEYSPIENTDRYSDHSVTRADNGSVEYGGSDTRTATEGGADTRNVTDGGQDQRVMTEDVAETSTEGHTGTDTRSITNGGQDETDTLNGGSDTGSTTNTRAAFNSGSYDPYDKSDTTTTYGQTEKVTAKYGGTTADSLQHGETVAGSGSTDRDVSDVTSYGKTQEDVLQYGRTHSEELRRATTETRTGGGSETYTEHTHGNIGVTTNQEMINQELRLLMEFNIYDWIAHKYEADMCLQIY